MKDNISPMITGRVVIKDADTQEILMDKYNAIHYENMALIIARSLAGNPEGHIYEMFFGNGGTSVSGTGSITFLPPNVNSADSELYNSTYYKIVDNRSPINADQSRNSTSVKHVTGSKFADVIIKCTLEYGEPSGQHAFDDASNSDGEYVFDEIGLKSFNVESGQGKLISHVIFSPIQKSLNRRIEVLYTIRIQLT